MKIRTKSALLAAIAGVTATACGGATSTEAEARAAEIEARTAEVKDEVAALEQSQADRSETDDDAQAADETGAEAEQELPRNNEDPDAEEAVNTAVETRADEFVVPTGTALTAAMDLEDIKQLALGSLGPTDDVAGVMGHFIRYPASVLTMPDSEIVAIEIVWQAGDPDRPDSQTTTSITRVHTSAEPAEAHLAFETHLAAAGWTIGNSGSRSTDAGVRFSLRALNAESRPLDISMEATDDATLIVIEWNDRSSVDEAAVRAVTGWYGDAPILDGGTYDISFLDVDESKLSFSSQFVAAGMSLDDVAASSADRFAASEWTLTGTGPVDDRSYDEEATLPNGEDVTSEFFKPASSDETRQTLRYALWFS